MKKETIIAIVLGIIAGISIAAVVILNTRNTSQGDDTLILEGVSPTVAIDRGDSSPLLITAPENEAVLDTTAVTLKGTAQKDSLIIMQTPTQEFAFQNTTQAFSRELELAPGENVIRVSSYTKKNVDSRTLTLYYIPSNQ